MFKKTADRTRLLDAIYKALEQNQGAVQTPALLIARWQTLTPREKEVASLIAQGLLNRDVGERLGGISIKTVQVHRGEVCRKLGVKGALGITRAVRAISDFDEAPAA